MVNALRTLAGLLLALAALPAPARAGEALGVLAVAEPPGPAEDLSALTRALRDALAARAPGVLEPGQLRDRMAGRAPPAVLAELDRAYAGALAAHAAGEFEDSNRTIRAVVEALETLPEGPAVFSAWSRAMLRLARSEQELGRGVEAQAVLERLVRAAPDLRADPRLYPPSFHGLVEEARARLRALGTRRLTVEAHPEARVFVEGREVGTTPVTVELAPGRYRVAGLRGGISAPARLIDLDGDRTVQLDVSLAEALRPDAGPGLALAGTDRPLRVLAAASRLALDRVVTTELLPAGPEVQLAATLHDVRRGTVERDGRIRLRSGAPAPNALALDALAGWLLAGTASALVSTPEGPSLALVPAPGESLLVPPVAVAPQPRRSPALGWAAVGTGAATLVAGSLAVVYAREAQSRYDDARAMLDPGGRVAPPNTVAGYNAAVLSGDDRRDTAVTLGVAAAVGAASTALLSYLSYRQTGEIGPFRF